MAQAPGARSHVAAMTPEQIIRSCKHCLGGACTACISTALDEARVAAVTAYASGNAHVCSNGKLKPIPEIGCGAGCGRTPRRSLREAAMVLDARMIGWTTAKAAAIEAIFGHSDYRAAQQDVESVSPPEEWSHLYETDDTGRITG